MSYKLPIETAPVLHQETQVDCVGDRSNWCSPPSLLSTTDGDSPSSKGSTDRSRQTSQLEGSNSTSPASSTNAPSDLTQQVQPIQQVLFQMRAQQEALQEAVQMAHQQQRRIKQEALEAQMIAHMQRFLASGDPTLVAEALAWAEVNPGLLEIHQLSLLPNLLTEEDVN